MTSRGWCFTLNNPDSFDLPSEWLLLQSLSIKLLAWQVEICPTTGTKHLQGFLRLKSPSRSSALRKICPKAHWEKQNGTNTQALNYVVKDESRHAGPWVYHNGEWMTDWKTFCSQYGTPSAETQSLTRKQVLHTIKHTIDSALADEDSSNAIIEDVADEYFDVWVSHYRAFETYIRMKTKPRNHPVEVHILQGPTGTGKSKWCMENFPDAYWKQRSNWWDGYTGQRVVVIDEFYGWLPYDLLLRICDRYPLLVETKGGQAQFVATTILLTTNMVPSSWYKNAYFPALARRVQHWHVLPVWGFHTVYHSWAEASKHMIENVNIP